MHHIESSFLRNGLSNQWDDHPLRPARTPLEALLEALAEALLEAPRGRAEKRRLCGVDCARLSEQAGNNTKTQRRWRSAALGHYLNDRRH
jgi:hypothetical protein